MEDGIRTNCNSFLAGRCKGIYINRYKEQVLECTTCPKCETGETLYSHNTVTVSQPWLGVESPAECGRLAGHGLAVTAQAALEEFPIGDLAPYFPLQLERVIYETTSKTSHVPMAPHQAKQGPARHLTLGWVAKRANCSHHEARQLIDCMTPLEATEDMARTFCRWARVRGIQATVQYLERFAIAAETSNQTGPAFEWVPHHQVWIGDRFHVISWVAKLVYPEPTEGETEPDYEWVPHRAVKIGTRYEIVSWIARPAHEEPNPETIEYHRVGEDNEDSPDWINQRPEIKEAIAAIQEIKDLAELKAFGHKLYEMRHNSAAARVLWSYYKAHMAYLQARAAKATPIMVSTIINRIKKATKRDLAGIGKALYNLQTGKAKANCNIKIYWSTIWSAYHEQKARLTA